MDSGVDTGLHEIFIHVKDPDNETIHPEVLMEDNQSTTLWDSVYLPLDFQQLISAQVIVLPRSTGDLRWNISTAWGKLCADEDYNQHTDSIAATETAVTDNKLSCVDISAAFTGVAAGDLIGFQFTREGGDVGDTLNAECAYLGARIRYV